MEVCGGYIYLIFCYGLEELLLDKIEMVYGLGCLVCVLFMGCVDDCVVIVEQFDVIFIMFGDVMWVLGLCKSLQQVNFDGCDVWMVYLFMDVLDIVCKNFYKNVVFFGFGFEIIMLSMVLMLLQVDREGIINFLLFCNYIIIIFIIKVILDLLDMVIDGFLGLGYVFMVIGLVFYEFIVGYYKWLLVIVGFELLDIL